MPGGLAAGQLVDERYALEDLLDEGALGTVWRAHDRGLGRTVCVREVTFPGGRFASEPGRLQDALRVARTSIRVDHRNAVHVYDAFVQGDVLVVVTELVPTRSLVAAMGRKHGLTAKRVGAIGMELADALAAAHGVGVVHGAIAPAVVLVPERGPAQLTGFGLAPAFDDDASTEWVDAAGAPAYVAPEQARLEGSSPAADLWALGATLYYAVEGADPFASSGAAAAHDLRPMTKAGGLAPVIESLLAGEPADRPSPQAVRAALAEAAGIAAAEEAAERGRRRARRERRRALEAENGEAGEAPAAAGTVAWDWDGAVGAPTPVAGDTPQDGPGWTDWSPGEVPVDASDLWLPGAANEDEAVSSPPSFPSLPSLPSPPALPSLAALPAAEAPAPPRLDLVASARSLSVPDTSAQPDPAEPDPADATAPAAAAAAAGGEESPPRQYRSSPSWPPPQGRRKFGVVVLCSLVMIVMLALLITNGRLLGRSANTNTTLSAKQRPVLSVDRDSVPANWITYRHPIVDFGLSYPPGWTVREEGDVVNIRDAASGAELRIQHTKPPGRDPESSFLELERGFYAQHRNDYRRLQLSPASYLDKVGALWEFTYAEDQQGVHAVDLGFLTKRYRFTLEFRAPAQRWDDLLAVFHAYLSSFRAPK